MSDADGGAEDIYRQMLFIRRFEERVLEMFGEGKLYGTTHTCIGQEATAVAVMAHLREGDIVWSNHRCHGHYLARYDDPEGLLAELTGKRAGVSGGRGGSQHLHRPGFYSSGIQGGYMPIAVGMAYAEKVKDSGNIVVAFIGDGTWGQGVVYEALNIAALKEVPLLVVVEANMYAQTTPTHVALAGSIIERAEALGVRRARHTDDDNVEFLLQYFGQTIEYIRDGAAPRVEVVHTYRLAPHSKGDDFRDPEELKRCWNDDPLALLGEQMDPDVRDRIEAEVMARLAEVEANVK